MKAFAIGALLFVLSCKKDSSATIPAAGDSVAAAPAELPPVDVPTTDTDATAPTVTPCTSDDDCVATCARRNECCDELCAPCPHAMHKADLAAHETWRKQCSKDRCPVARCAPPKERTVASCQSGTCVVQRLPL